MVICQKCGGQNRGGAKFCSSCGADLSPIPGESSRATIPLPAEAAAALLQPTTSSMGAGQAPGPLTPLPINSVLSHPRDPARRYSIAKAWELEHSIYYDALVDYVLAHMKRELEASERTPRVQKPLTIILSGGSAMPQGFHPRFEEKLRVMSLPVPVGEVRLAAQPLYSVAKGALVAARADESKR